MIREVAEYPNAYVELRPGQERVETDRYTLCLERSRYSATVQRQRFAADDVDLVLAEVRETLRARGRGRTQWEIGSAARPQGLAAQLLARGLKLDDDPVAIAMAMRRAPPPPLPGLEARRVTTLEEYAAAHEVQLEAFGETGSARGAEQRALLADEWREGPKLMHAVWLQEEMVGSGSCARTPHGLALFGGATLPGARGRGVYRTLLAARWNEAERLGAPALVTQAGAMSGPILRWVGFEAVGRVEMLIDEFDAAS